MLISKLYTLYIIYFLSHYTIAYYSSFLNEICTIFYRINIQFLNFVFVIHVKDLPNMVNYTLS